MRPKIHIIETAPIIQGRVIAHPGLLKAASLSTKNPTFWEAPLFQANWRDCCTSYNVSLPNFIMGTPPQKRILAVSYSQIFVAPSSRQYTIAHRTFPWSSRDSRSPALPAFPRINGGENGFCSLFGVRGFSG